MTPTFCDTCTFWNFCYDNGGDKYGSCSNPSFPENVRITMDDDEDEYELFTKSTFCCNEFEHKDQDLTVTGI